MKLHSYFHRPLRSRRKGRKGFFLFSAFSATAVIVIYLRQSFFRSDWLVLARGVALMKLHDKVQGSGFRVKKCPRNTRKTLKYIYDNTSSILYSMLDVGRSMFDVHLLIVSSIIRLALRLCLWRIQIRDAALIK